MEKFVNNVMVTLSTSFDKEQLNKIRNALYFHFKDYELVKKSTELVVPEDFIPREVQLYLVARKIEGLADSSLDQYKRTLTQLFTRTAKQPAEIKTEDLRIYFYEIQKLHNMSNRSLDTQRIYINAFFNWCVLNEYLEKNVCAKIKPFKYEEKLKEGLTDMELEQVRLACKSKQEKAIIEVLYSTGCRVSELTNLKLEDINLTTREVIIHHGKGDKERKTYLNSKSILAIQDYIADRDYESVYLFENFRKPHNKLKPAAIQATCRRLGRECHIYLHPHKIRRTTATHLYVKGASLEKVQHLLGHKDINTTEIYARIDDSQVREAHAKYL